MIGGKFLNITNRKILYVDVTATIMLVIKGATTQTFLFFEVS